jgi:hypothetical protein
MPETPAAPAAVPLLTAQSRGPQPFERCLNVEAEDIATLGIVTLPDGTTGFGGVWTPMTLGTLSGEMASVLVGQETSGSKEQGASHLRLKHAFRTASGDYFMTEDRAVCAPAGTDPQTCRVNDVLTIVSGTGVFSNANGTLRNHGTADFVAGTLAFSIRGRICGDGL